MSIGLNRAAIVLAFTACPSELIMTVPWLCSATVDLVVCGSTCLLIVSHALSVSVPRPCDAQTKSYYLL